MHSRYNEIQNSKIKWTKIVISLLPFRLYGNNMNYHLSVLWVTSGDFESVAKLVKNKNNINW